MFCGNCGAEIPEVKFCPKCGAAVAHAKTAEVATENVYADEPTVMAAEEATVFAADEATAIAYDDATVAARDFDATMAAPVYGMGAAGENIEPQPATPMPLDPKAAKKAKKAEKKVNKKPMSTKKKVLVAISSVLAFVIVLGSVAVGIVAFTPKYKFMLALRNSLLNTKSFSFEGRFESEGHSNYSEMYGEDYSGYDDYYSSVVINGAMAFGDETADTSLYAVVDYAYENEGLESYYDSDYYESSGDYYYDDYYDYDYNDSYEYDWDYDRFKTLYVVSNGGEALAGQVNGEDNEAHYGRFIAGNIKALADYGEENFDKIVREFDNSPTRVRKEFKDITSVDVETAIGWAKTLVSGNKVNEDVVEEVFNSIVRSIIEQEFNAEMVEYKEVKKLFVNFWLKGINEKAFKIKNSRIEDGMTKYDITIDIYELLQCFIDYVENNEELEDFIYEIDRSILRNLKDIDRGDVDTFDFTLGTKNMRFVYFSYNYSYESSGYESETNVEFNIKDVNKKIDFTSYYNDIKEIADEWKENYIYIKDEQDIINN